MTVRSDAIARLYVSQAEQMAPLEVEKNRREKMFRFSLQVAVVSAFSCVFWPTITTSASADTYRVAMMIDLSNSNANRAVAAVKGYLVDIPVDFIVEGISQSARDLRQLHRLADDVASRRDAKIVFWVDISEPEQLFLYIATSDGGKTLIRNIDSREESLDTRLDAIATIVRTSVRAIISGGKIGIIIPETKETSNTEPQTSPGVEIETKQFQKKVSTEKKSPLIDLSLAYCLSIYSAEALTIHGARVGIATYFDKGIRIFLAYRIEMPFSAETQLLKLEVFTHPAEIGGVVEWNWALFGLRIGAFLVFDWVTWKVTTRQMDVSERHDQLNFRIAVSPLLSFHWRALRFLSLYLALSAEVFLYQSGFYYKEGDQEKELLDPWVVSPLLQIGVKFQIFG